MSRPAISALYFVLTFIAGAAVGSWALWIYLMGFQAAQENAPPPSAAAPAISTPSSSPSISAPAASPPPLPSPPPRIGSAPAIPEDAPATRLSPSPGDRVFEDTESTPTPKGHWNTVDVPGRSHEECLALHKELNDAYKDCRFGVHKKEWVPE